ncbi:MAG: hypothetical protein RL288_208 [Actinomycetota bacterium]
MAAKLPPYERCVTNNADEVSAMGIVGGCCDVGNLLRLDEGYFGSAGCLQLLSLSIFSGGVSKVWCSALH